MSSQALWYLTRATGIVALILLTATIVLGVLGAGRFASRRWPRIVTAGLHRNLALTATGLVAVHVITTLLDPFVPISLAAVFIPFASSYRPVWLGLGALAFDLLLAVLLTSLLRQLLTHRTWQAVHLLVYVCWPIALWHALGTGTDTRLGLVLAIDVACVLAVIVATWWRLSLIGDRRRLRIGLAALAFLTVVTVIFLAAGPLQPGWADRAGTSAGLFPLVLAAAAV